MEVLRVVLAAALLVVVDRADAEPSVFSALCQTLREPTELRLADPADVAREPGIGLLTGRLALMALSRCGVHAGYDDPRVRHLEKRPRLLK